MGRRQRVAAGLAVVLLAITAACSACSDDDDLPRVTTGDGYLAVLDWALPHAFPELDADDPNPVVFIATSDGSPISPQAQATVARDADERIDVNFVDAADDAIDPDSNVEAVRDDGVLLTISPIEDGAASATEVDVGLYRNYVDQTQWALLLEADDDGVRVAQETELVIEEAPGQAPPTEPPTSPEG
jgi:hypothetical protein